MMLKIKLSAFAGLALLLICNVSHAEGLTEQQGDAIYQELKKIRILLEQNNAANLKPEAIRSEPMIASATVKGAPIIGNANAPITLVEYTDYQCAYCYKFFKDTYPQLKQKYIDTGKLSLIIKDLPLSFHPDARKAAQAARCAGDQNKFLEMHDTLYKNSQRLAEKNLLQYAKEISLDVSVFKSCLASDHHLTDIDRETEEAQKAGVRGTPTFVLGKKNEDVIVGTRIVGAKSMLEFERHIRELITKLIAQDNKSINN